MTPQGRVARVAPARVQEPKPGDSLELTIDVDMQRTAEKALQWAMDLVGLKRGVFIVDEPADRRDPGHGLAAQLRQQPLRAMASAATDYKKLLKDPAEPLLNFAINEQFPPGSTYKLVTGSGALQDGKITAQTRLRTAAYITHGRGTSTRTGTRPASATIDDLRRLRALQRHLLLPGRRMAGHRPARLLGAPVRASARRRASICRRGRRASIPTNAWKERVFNQPIYPGET